MDIGEGGDEIDPTIGKGGLGQLRAPSPLLISRGTLKRWTMVVSHKGRVRGQEVVICV